MIDSDTTTDAEARPWDAVPQALRERLFDHFKLPASERAELEATGLLPINNLWLLFIDTEDSDDERLEIVQYKQSERFADELTVLQEHHPELYQQARAMASELWPLNDTITRLDVGRAALGALPHQSDAGEASQRERFRKLVTAKEQLCTRVIGALAQASVPDETVLDMVK